MREELLRSVPIAAAAVFVAAVFLLGPLQAVVEAQAVGPYLVEQNALLPANARLVFRNPRGLQRYYAFFYYPGDFTWFYKYSSDGIKWSPVQGGMDGGLGSASIWVFDSGFQLIVHLTVTDLIGGGTILYRRGTISDTSEAISWSSGQVVESGGSNARKFGLSMTRTSTGRPVITSVAEVFNGATYRYDVQAWGANADVATPTWTRATLIPGFQNVKQQTGGFTSAYAAGGNYVFVAGSAARALQSTASPWDVSWVRASWDGTSWSVGTVRVLSSTQSAARPVSLVEDDALLPHALVLFPPFTGASGPLVHYRGTSPDGGSFQTFTVSSQPVTSMTLSIDLTSTPKKLKAIYHYGTSNIYWKESPTSPVSWGVENILPWSMDTTDLSSSQRDFVGRIHGLAESSGGVFYFGI